MEKVVIVKIIGGVGNQFFQYCAGKALAKKIGATLKFDLCEFEEYGIRNYELMNFDIEQNIASENEIAALKKKKIFNKTYFKEKSGKFYPEIFSAKNSVYLEGYFQSEKYFKNIEDEIRQDFRFKNLDFLQNDDFKKYLEEIKAENAVCVSVRGGDYINNPKNEAIYNVCGKNYYQNAINYIKNHVNNPKIYVTSDDIEYAKTIIGEDVSPTFIDIKDWKKSLYLIQNCRHIIIANSSFAWMGAWLNENLNKIVLAPKKWYKDGVKIDFQNVVCKSWIKVGV